ncbi:unnamed protein product [Camellia sinensis]
MLLLLSYKTLHFQVILSLCMRMSSLTASNVPTPATIPSGHPWVQVDGVAPDKPLDPAVLSHLTYFSAMNKLEKIALRVNVNYGIRSHCYIGPLYLDFNLRWNKLRDAIPP